MNFITAYCHISKESVSMNGETILRKDETTTDDFIKKIYKNSKLDYPKFYKMDMLSKFAFLGTEILKNHCAKIIEYTDDAIALLFSNSVSSADTDIKFQKSYQVERSPSPALFVYTLPNILIGEIAIRNKWFGENLFTILPNFDSAYFTMQCNIILEKKAEAVLCGWINVLDENIETFIFFAEKKHPQKMNLPLNSETLSILYKNKI